MAFNRSVFIASAVAALLIAGGGAYVVGVQSNAAPTSEDGGGDGPPPAVVQTATAVTASLAPSSEVPGSVVSVQDSLIAAATSGKIEWVAEVGAVIAKGEIIARIDPADAAIARDDAAAEIRRLQARADYLDRNYERFVGLGDESGESEASLDAMRADRDEARVALDRARVALRRAETMLDRTEVRAPFDGRVVSREIQVGEFAAPGAAIARLVDIGTLEVSAQAPSALVGNVAPGDTVSITHGADRVAAPIRAIVPVGDEISRTLELRLALDDADWHIGAAVQVRLPSAAARMVTAAPRDALVLRANRVSVYTIDDDNIAHRRDVRLGAADGDLIEVIGDVAPGDRLVIRGGERLRDGQAVEIADQSDPASS
ncbi:MAG: efflux RND transporter periplasmic adaptor subunit [Pseudomonadota bacterium]